MAVLAGAAGAGGGPKEYGDAPDQRSAGYSGKAADVIGRFPSLARSGGPAHSVVGPLRLGAKVDRELDSRQVDREVTDDGVFADLAPCKKSTLVFLVNAAGLPQRLRAAGHVAYLNAWFDWNRSGTWGFRDRCANEWAVRNYRVDLTRFPGGGRRVAVHVPITAGAQTHDLWMRATLTLDQRSASPEGRVEAPRYGETEDYGTSPPDGDGDGYLDFEQGVQCRGPSDPVEGPHGVPIYVPLSWYEGIPGFVSWSILPPANAKITVGGLPADVELVGAGPGGVTVRGKRHPRQPVREVFNLVINVKVPKGLKTRLEKCTVAIVHSRDFEIRLIPTFDHDPDPQSDICAAISTEPRQPGAKALARLAGPREGAVVGSAEQPLVLDGKGEARARWLVSVIGRYRLAVAVTSGGVTREAETTIDNSSPSGRCTG